MTYFNLAFEGIFMNYQIKYLFWPFASDLSFDSVCLLCLRPQPNIILPAFHTLAAFQINIVFIVNCSSVFCDCNCIKTLMFLNSLPLKATRMNQVMFLP
jgi:hypothetical protein